MPDRGTTFISAGASHAKGTATQEMVGRNSDEAVS